MTKEISKEKASTPTFFDFFNAAMKLIVYYAQLKIRLRIKKKKKTQPKQRRSYGPEQDSQYMSKAGLKCIEDVFPTIPEVATEFFKKNGFKVQQKRQNNDFISCGVTVKQVKEHFLKVITGLVNAVFQTILSSLFSDLILSIS